MSDSLGLVDFAIKRVNSVLNLPGGQGPSFEIDFLCTQLLLAVNCAWASALENCLNKRL